MTTGNETVQPTEVTPAATQVSEDELELQQAHEAAKAEENASKPAEGETVVPATPTPGAPDPKASADQPMIPKARLDEVLSAKDKAEQNAAYWKGVADARATTAPAAASAPEQTEQQTPVQRIAALREQKYAIAKKFDDGELSATDKDQQCDAIEDQIHAIREESIIAKTGRTTSDDEQIKKVSDHLDLQNRTAELETAHKWVGVFDQVGNDADWNYLKAQAIQKLVDRGIDPRQDTPTNRYELRKEMAQLADEIGPGLLTKRAQAKGIALPEPGQPQPAVSAQTRQAKLEVAAGAPPSVPAMSGTASSTPGQYTDAQVEAMTDAEYDKLPTSTRQRLLGITAA